MELSRIATITLKTSEYPMSVPTNCVVRSPADALNIPQNAN